MPENLVVALLVLAVLVGIGGASYAVFRSPAFWGDVASEFVSRAWPLIVGLIAKRMTPEEEAEWRAAERAGRGDEWLRKRRGAPPKG